MGPNKKLLPTLSILEEKDLFSRIAGGDEAAFTEIFHYYTPQIEPVITRMTGSAAVARDLIQDIFLGIWLAREKLGAIESPPNWIFRIVYNKTYTWLENRSVKERVHGQMEEKQLEAPVKNQTEEAVQFAETARLVRKAVSALAPQTKKIYLLSRESGLKPAEIAETLGLSVQTVKNTLTNSLHSIRDYLAREGVILPMVLLIYWRI